MNPVDDILAKYAPPETFQIALTPEHRFTFRAITDYDEWIKLHAQVEGFSRQIKAEQYPVEWKPFVPETETAQAKIYMIHRALVEPKLELIDVMRLAKGFGSGFFALADTFAQMTTLRAAALEAEAVAEGKDATPTPTSE